MTSKQIFAKAYRDNSGVWFTHLADDAAGKGRDFIRFADIFDVWVEENGNSQNLWVEYLTDSDAYDTILLSEEDAGSREKIEKWYQVLKSVMREYEATMKTIQALDDLERVPSKVKGTVIDMDIYKAVRV